VSDVDHDDRLGGTLSIRFHTIVEDWERLEARAKAVYDGLPEESKVPFYELIYVSIRLQANLNRLSLAGE
jgi:hypothetical protein